MTEPKSKNSFLFGLISGIAGISVIGLIVFAALFFTQGGQGTDTPAEVAGDNEQQEQPQVVFDIEEGDHLLGSPDAEVKIFSFSDFQCPYCARFHTVLHQIVEEYPDDVAWVFRQFPIQSHPMGMPGAVATECAGDQGKFWEMSDIIFENQQTLSLESFSGFATELGLDTEKFNTCLEENPYLDKISSDYATGIEAGVTGTPSSFVNGQMIPGALPFEQMKQVVEQLIAQ